jgi:hypothetical protein
VVGINRLPKRAWDGLYEKPSRWSNQKMIASQAPLLIDVDRPLFHDAFALTADGFQPLLLAFGRTIG